MHSTKMQLFPPLKWFSFFDDIIKSSYFLTPPQDIYLHTLFKAPAKHILIESMQIGTRFPNKPRPLNSTAWYARTIFPLLVLLTLTLQMIWDPPEAVLFPEVSNALSPSRLTRRPIIFLCAAMVHIKPIKASSSSTQRMKLSWKCSILLRTSGRSDCRLLSAHTNVKEPSAKALQENNIVTYCGRCKIDERALVYFSERTSQTLTVNKQR